MFGLGLQAFDQHLRTDDPRPLAVAFSGGGDSLALLLLAREWGEAHGRRLMVLNLDHGLQAASRDWAEACAARAERLGLPFQALTWTGEKPVSGLPAAARAARHRLLGEAARQAGARVLLMGHTADDVMEAAAMRAEGSTTPSPRPWAPSPAWPEGRGVFVLRPLLGLRRAALRDWLRARGEDWIDDPANDDPAYARPRARQRLAGGETPPISSREDMEFAGLAQAIVTDLAGGLRISRAQLRDAPPEVAARLAAAACVCAGGGPRSPRGDRLTGLVQRLRAASPVTATLAGARIEAGEEAVGFWREPGEMRRTAVPTMALPVGATRVWDGRFEILCERPGLSVQALSGFSARLPRDQQAGLKALPVAARGAMPVLIDEGGGAVCPLLAPCEGVTVRALAYERLLAASGAVACEPA